MNWERKPTCSKAESFPSVVFRACRQNCPEDELDQRCPHGKMKSELLYLSSVSSCLMFRSGGSNLRQNCTQRTFGVHLSHGLPVTLGGTPCKTTNKCGVIKAFPPASLVSFAGPTRRISLMEQKQFLLFVLRAVQLCHWNLLCFWSSTKQVRKPSLSLPPFYRHNNPVR